MAITDAQLIQIENEALSLNARADRIEAQINDYVSTVNTGQDPSSQLVTNGKALEAEAVDTLARLNQFNNSPAVNEVRAYGDLREQQRVNQVLEVIRRARSRTDTALTDIRSTLAGIGTAEPPPSDATNSAAQIVGDGATNRTENATVQNPETETEQGQLASETPTNADGVTTRGLADFEDDETNAISEDNGRSAPQTPTPTTGANGISVNRGYNEVIRPRDNILSRFGTYTYGITIYLMSTQEYRDIMVNGVRNIDADEEEIQTALKNVSNLSAIVSSGGMASLDNARTDDLAKRATINGESMLDYYIDDLEIESLMPQHVRGASNATLLNFKIIEPYGFTFIQNLKELVDQKCDGGTLYNQHYLMVIRFYGQEDSIDQNSTGEFVDATGGVSSNGQVNVTAQEPLTEKYIPFKFSKIVTKARTGAVEYQCEAVPINHMAAMSVANATTKFQVEIKGQTLEELFNGKDSNTSGQTLKTGLMEAINKYWRDLADPQNPRISIPNRYRINFRDDLGTFRIVQDGDPTKKNRTAMADPTAAPGVFNKAKNNMQNSVINFSVNAGTQIQQVIDLVMRSSDYITRQQKKVIDPNTREVRDNDAGYNDLLQWYRITSHVDIIGWDDIRQDYAYDITYDVIRSAISDPKTPFFPKRRFNGCQKRYKYWFTGENTEILDYEVEYNSLFFTSSSPALAQDSGGDGTISETSSPGPSEQSIIGGRDLTSDPAARVASVLYSPADYATLSMKIMGDPFYIQQGDIFWRSLGVDNTNPGYLPDGSADYDSGEVLLEVDFKTMVDYDEETGDAKIVDVLLKSEEERLNTVDTNGVAYPGLIYQVIQVVNHFSNGVFTQDIGGVLRQHIGDYERTAAIGQIVQNNNSQPSPLPPPQQVIQVPPVKIPPVISSTPPQSTWTIPSLGGLELTGAGYQAPPEDAG